MTVEHEEIWRRVRQVLEGKVVEFSVFSGVFRDLGFKPVIYAACRIDSLRHRLCRLSVHGRRLKSACDADYTNLQCRRK